MTLFKKSVLCILMLNISFLFSQDLERKVPANSQAVITVNGGQILSLFSIDKFNNSIMGKEIIKELKREVKEFNSIEDFGVDLNGKAYFYYQPQDSVSYFSFLLPVKNGSKFTALFNNERDFKERQTWGDATILIENDVVIIQDDNAIQFCFADVPYGYFDGQMEDLKLKYPDLKEYEIRRKISKEWMLTKAKQNYQPARSIVSDKSYVENKDRNAEASVWVKNYGSLMNSYYQSTMGYLMDASNDLMKMPNFNKYGMGTLAAHMHFNKGNVVLNSTIEVNAQMQKSLKKMYKSKMNNSFYNYTNLNDAMAYMTFSMNSTGMLEEYPTMVTQLYGSMLPKFEEEIALGAEMMATFMDEKAIGELMTGNAIFVLDGISEKEVDYVTNEYDEEYNKKQVTKKKKEMLPDFTLVIGTKRKDLASKLAILGIKHKVLTGGNYRYKSTAKSEIPFPLFLSLKDDAIIISTSEVGFENQSRQTNSSIKKNIKKNIMVWNIDFQKMMKELPKEEIGMDDKTLNQITRNLKSATLISSRMKGNKMHTIFTLNTPTDELNSLEMFMNFIDEMMK